MYRISKSIRTKRSAALICEALEKCLEEKPFDKITIEDIRERCFVSRATFYRLFDELADVLSYECDNIFEERLRLAKSHEFADKKDRALYCIKIWLNHANLMKALVENNLCRILFNTHKKNADLLKKLYPIPFTDEKKADYFISILSSSICSALAIYFKHGATEPIEDVYAAVCECMNVISESFSAR